MNVCEINADKTPKHMSLSTPELFPPSTLINLNIVLAVIRCWMLPWAEDMNGQNIEWNSVFSQADPVK